MPQEQQPLTEVKIDPPFGDAADEDGLPAPDFALDESVLGQSDSVFDNATVVADPALPPPAAAPRQRSSRSTQQRVLVREDLSRRERRRRVKLQARKVRRIIRHIEPWSVLKISFVFFVCLWVILVLAGVMLWSVAVSSGTVESAEELIRDLLADSEFEFKADTIFRVYAMGGLVLVIAGTAFSVLLCVMFNLISDLMGGVRITVIEEESARFRPPRRRLRR